MCGTGVLAYVAYVKGDECKENGIGYLCSTRGRGYDSIK